MKTIQFSSDAGETWTPIEIKKPIPRIEEGYLRFFEWEEGWTFDDLCKFHAQFKKRRSAVKRMLNAGKNRKAN